MSYLPDDYEPVEDRIRAFYKDHPQGRIVPDEKSFDHKEVRFRVAVYRDLDPDPHPAAVGHAHGFVGAEKDYEKTETVAIGRALANLGYAKQGARPSREEMQAFDQVKHDVGNARGPKANHRASELMTEGQRAAIYGGKWNGKTHTGLKNDLSETTFRNTVTDYFGEYRDPETWTKYEAMGDKKTGKQGLLDVLYQAKNMKRDLGKRSNGRQYDEYTLPEPPEDRP